VLDSLAGQAGQESFPLHLLIVIPAEAGIHWFSVYAGIPVNTRAGDFPYKEWVGEFSRQAGSW
jgi:hypothetical protein